MQCGSLASLMVTPHALVILVSLFPRVLHHEYFFIDILLVPLSCPFDVQRVCGTSVLSRNTWTWNQGRTGKQTINPGVCRQLLTVLHSVPPSPLDWYPTLIQCLFGNFSLVYVVAGGLSQNSKTNFYLLLQHTIWCEAGNQNMHTAGTRVENLDRHEGKTQAVCECISVFYLQQTTILSTLSMLVQTSAQPELQNHSTLLSFSLSPAH